MSAVSATREPSRWKLSLARVAVALTILLIALALLLRVALRPEFVARVLLQRVGNALGLQITAQGAVEIRLRGTPQLVLRKLDAREPGATRSILRADRLLLAVPWSTLRARGASLDVERMELDAPVLDLPALQAWQAKRPASETRIPTLTHGLAIRDGRIDNNDWRIERIRVDLPRLHPAQPVNVRLGGHYLAPPTTLDFDLAVALTRPANHVGAAAIGSIAIARGDWRLPALIKFSGPLHLGSGDLRITPARLGMSASYQSGKTRLPFVLGLYGPLHFDEATWTLAPVGMVLRGDGVLPSFDARGAIALGKRLVLRLDGRMPGWKDTWPALPPPLGQSTSPLPFRLDYVGKLDASDIASLRVQRDQTSFDGRFRLPALMAWIDAPPGSPIPPLDGHASMPQLQVSGAQLEGVEVEMDDPDIEDAAGNASR